MTYRDFYKKKINEDCDGGGEVGPYFSYYSSTDDRKVFKAKRRKKHRIKK